MPPTLPVNTVAECLRTDCYILGDKKNETLRVSCIFFAYHQEFCIIHSALVSFMQVLMTASKQSQDETASRHQQN